MEKTVSIDVKEEHTLEKTWTIWGFASDGYQCIAKKKFENKPSDEEIAQFLVSNPKIVDARVVCRYRLDPLPFDD